MGSLQTKHFCMMLATITIFIKSRLSGKKFVIIIIIIIFFFGGMGDHQLHVLST